MRINAVFVSLCSGSVPGGDYCGADANISLSKQIDQELVGAVTSVFMRIPEAKLTVNCYHAN
jgi:hypothetical protein